MTKQFMLLLALLSVSYLYPMEQDKSVTHGYAEIAAIAFESEKLMDADIPKVDPKAKLEDKANSLLKVQSDVEVKRLTFKLFDTSDKRPFSSIMKSYSLREINVLVGDEENKDLHLMAQIDQTKSFAGKAVLARLISEPTSSLETITKRQAALKSLVKDAQAPTLNTNLYKSLTESLTSIGNNEKMLLNNWNIAANLDSELAKQVYFSGAVESLNKLKNGCEYLRRLKLSGVAIYGVTAIGYLGFLGYMFKKPISQIYITWKEGKISTKEAAKPVGMMAGSGAVAVGVMAYGWYQTKQQFDALQYTSKSLYKRMLPVATIFRQIDNLYIALNQNNASSLIAVTGNYQQLKDFCENTNLSDKLMKLKEVLLTDTFIEGTLSWTTRLGDAATAYALLQDVKDELIPVLIAVGSLDAYVSVAKTYAEQAKNTYRYNFAQFVSAETPSITLKGLFNPLVNANAVIASDVTLGESNKANMILTGPHGGGKSTYMKAIGYAVILAQTFGIVPAQECSITLFDTLHTYSNIKEKLGQGQSTFMAEKKRIDEIQTSLNTIGMQKAFTIVDEPLKGTMEAEGSIRVTNFLKAVLPITQSLLVIATHFEKPARLESEFTSRVASAHPDLIENEDNTFVRTFKILPGINEWWFNDSIKRERYIDWLTQQ